MSLSHDDVERLLRILDASQFDELELETEGIRLSLRRRGAASSATAGPNGSGAPGTAATADPRPPAAPPSAAAAPAAGILAPGLVEIRSPMLGTFYRAPKPGAAPFVELGSRVDAGATIGIIEVMKLMNSVAAEAAGEVAEIVVRDGELVEFDQPLMRLRPAGAD